MRHDDEAPGNDGWFCRAGEALTRNRLLIGCLALAIAVGTIGSVLASMAFDKEGKTEFALALTLLWLAALIAITGFAVWADRRVRVQQSLLRAMGAACQAAGVHVPGVTDQRGT